jgi:hypothetical protein
MQRKWRERELEAVRRKQREVEELKSIREEQVRQKREAQATGACDKEKEVEKNASENEKLRNELLELQCKQIEVWPKAYITLL